MPETTTPSEKPAVLSCFLTDALRNARQLASRRDELVQRATARAGEIAADARRRAGRLEVPARRAAHDQLVRVALVLQKLAKRVEPKPVEVEPAVETPAPTAQA